MRNAFESCEMMGVVDGSKPVRQTTQITYREASYMEKEGQPCKGHDHAVREGRPRHQGRPRQTRKKILDMFASEYSQTGSGSIMPMVQAD